VYKKLEAGFKELHRQPGNVKVCCMFDRVMPCCDNHLSIENISSLEVLGHIGR